MEKNDQETQVDSLFKLKDRHGASPEVKECVAQWMVMLQIHKTDKMDRRSAQSHQGKYAFDKPKETPAVSRFG
jgi:hypothetical protein